MASRTKTSDLYTNKDELLSISTFMSLKRLNAMRKTSKRVNKWLSDPTTISWKKRIELAFPSSFQEVLKEDMNEQVARLKKFDTLVDAGHQVSFIQLSSLLQIESANVTAKYQLPWARYLFLIIYNDNEVILFDSLVGKDFSRVSFSEIKSIDAVLFDIKEHKVGFLNNEAGAMKLYRVRNNALTAEANFNSFILKFGGLINQIYGDYMIVNDGSKLVWYSLSSNTAVKEIDLPEDDGEEGLFVRTSTVEQVIYIIAPYGSGYTVNVVDCTLAEDTPMKELYSADSDISYDNCGDGVEGIQLIETEDGQVLNVYLLGTGDREVQAYDLGAQKEVKTMLFREFYDYDSIVFNPGSDFYIVKDGPVLAVKNTFRDYADKKCDVPARFKNSDDEDSAYKDPEEESWFEEEKEEPTKGAYFKFNSKVVKSQWLNKDLLTVKSAKKQRFFSIAKRGIIGSIDDDINEVFISGNTIVAFTAQGDVYRVTLASNDEEKPKKKNKKRAMSSGNEDDEPQKKVQAR